LMQVTPSIAGRSGHWFDPSIAHQHHHPWPVYVTRA
jgi:hypothetical protein